MNWNDDLDAMVRCGHPIGAANKYLLDAVGEIKDSTVFEEATDDALTLIVSERPGTPGRNMQMPRTIRSIRTPACDA